VIRTSAVATFLLVAGVDTAPAVDLKDLMPCRSAALRMCDRSQGMNEAALRKCGATLASRHHEVSRRCVDVLIRYGQLSHKITERGQGATRIAGGARDRPEAMDGINP
jgi:hypothetical protein